MIKNCWRRACTIGLTSLLLSVSIPSMIAEASHVPMISVGLETNKTSYTVSANTAFTVTDAIGKKVFLKLCAGDTVTVAGGKKGITLNGKSITGDRVMFRVDAKAKQGQLSLNGTPYRGMFIIGVVKGKTGLTAINRVALEEYLYGVVPNEMSPSWATEALKAQAVAARTFALHDMKKHAEDGYDVCAATHCQVYRGSKSEHKQTTDAVDRTAGEYLAYKGKIIISLFHASGGGYTENSENVWGKHEPYLRGVADYDHSAPHYRWEVKLSVVQFVSVLGDRARKLGKIRSIKLSKLGQAPMYTNDRGISGRVRSIVLEGDKGSITLSGTEARALWGLKSTLFDIDKRTFSGKADDTLTISGRGFGHGLGLSQWGAKTMAEKGGNKNGLYKSILSHYYRDTELKKI